MTCKSVEIGVDEKESEKRVTVKEMAGGYIDTLRAQINGIGQQAQNLQMQLAQMTDLLHRCEAEYKSAYPEDVEEE